MGKAAKSLNHVWLRTVKLGEQETNKNNPVDPLVKRQEQVRVCTELVLQKKVDVPHWMEVLTHIENGAGYFRLIGKVAKTACWSSSKPSLGLASEPSDSGADQRLVVLGAYPEFDTYFNVREALFANQEYYTKTKPLRYALTHLLWEPRVDAERVVWNAINSFKKFIVILVRDFEGRRSDKLKDVVAHDLVLDAKIPHFEYHDDSLVVGEWDHFALFRATADTDVDWNVVAAKCKEAFKGMQRVRFLGCDASG